MADTLTATYALRLGDDALILSHRLSEWVGHGPELEEDIALANTALDLLGQARLLLSHAGECEGRNRDEDALAYGRDVMDFSNLLLVEQPNGDFAQTMMRQFLFDAYAVELWPRLSASHDEILAGIAGKAAKEAAYHVEQSAAWVVRMGDGTEESHARIQAGLDLLWPYASEMFEADEVEVMLAEKGIAVASSDMQAPWQTRVEAVLENAGLAPPQGAGLRTGGRQGRHSEHLGHLLAAFQFLQRAYPGAEW